MQRSFVAATKELCQSIVALEHHTGRCLVEPTPALDDQYRVLARWATRDGLDSARLRGRAFADERPTPYQALDLGLSALVTEYVQALVPIADHFARGVATTRRMRRRYGLARQLRRRIDVWLAARERIRVEGQRESVARRLGAVTL